MSAVRTTITTIRLLLALAVTAPLAVVASPPTAVAAAATYTVKKGDTLASIGRMTGIPWQTIADRNGITAPYTITVGQVLRLSSTAPAAPAYKPPSFASKVPATTSQVIRTVRTNTWCTKVHCTVTEAWQKETNGRWRLVKAYRSQIGPKGFSDPAKRKEGDNTTPAGVYTVVTTFSTDAKNPGMAMPWKRRLPTSTVSGDKKYYNTWIEEKGRKDGTRPAMRWGLWINYNNGRLVPNQGPAPVVGKGAGIFLHTMPSNAKFSPSAGCVAVGDPAQAKWLVMWLKPASNPRIVNNV